MGFVAVLCAFVKALCLVGFGGFAVALVAGFVDGRRPDGGISAHDGLGLESLRVGCNVID